MLTFAKAMVATSRTWEGRLSLFIFGVALSIVAVLGVAGENPALQAAAARAEQNKTLVGIVKTERTLQQELLSYTTLQTPGARENAYTYIAMLKEKLARLQNSNVDVAPALDVDGIRLALAKLETALSASSGAISKDQIQSIVTVSSTLAGNLDKSIDDMADHDLQSAQNADDTFHHVLEVTLLGCMFAMFILSMRGLYRVGYRFEQLDLSGNRQAQLYHALDLSSEGICLIDKAGYVRHLNAAAARMFGLDEAAAQKMLGRLWLDLFSVDRRRHLMTKVMPQVMTKNAFHEETTIDLPNGESRDVELSMHKIREGGIALLLHDISLRRATEQRLQHIRQQYYQAQKLESLGRLAGGIAHDFNNVLSSISGYTQFLLQDLRRGSEEYEFSQKISQGIDQAKQLVDRLLTFSRTQSAGMAQVDLVQLCHEAASMLEAGFRHKIKVDTDLGLAKCFLTANPVQLQQVLMNLGVNAHDAMENGGTITMRLSLAAGRSLQLPDDAVTTALPQEEADPEPYQHIEAVDDSTTKCIIGRYNPNLTYAVLRISDSGTGIPRAVVEQMFEPFFTTKEIGKGTGLGLATVYGLTMAHKGLVMVETTLKKGTTFSIILPMPPEVAHIPAETTARFMAITENEDREEEDDELTEGVSILVVDDQSEVRGTICTMLKRGGYTVYDSPSGLEAVDLVRENPDMIDMVVTDYSMPNMSGLELASEIALIRKSLPVILISGFAEADTQRKIENIPTIRDFIRIPVQANLLLAKVRAILDAEGAE